MITAFQNDNRYLSNFWYASTRNDFDDFDNITYPTSEHAYQAAKTVDMSRRLIIARLHTPGEAKRAGRQLIIREDWEIIKRLVMLNLVRSKFDNNMTLGYKLASTGNVQLIEGNTWHDNYWGMCYCTTCKEHKIIGKNWLGKLLMHIRVEQQLKLGLEG